MSRKRIAIFGWAQSVHIQRWVRGLTSRGYEIKLISVGGEPLDGIDTYIIPRTSRAVYFTKAKEAIAVARAFKPDLVHAHFASGFGLWARKVGLHPTILSVWGSDVVDFGAHWPGRSLVRKALAGVDHVTVTSRMLRRVTREIVDLPMERISIIPFGVDLPPEVKDLPAGDLKKICFIKHHYRKYGPEVLIEATAIAHTAMPEIRLSIAGEGPLTNELKTQVKRLGLEKVVRFVGFIDNARIGDFLQDHHFMVMPSLKEAFGVAVLETSANGRAVIASDVGGVPEVLIDGETGLLVPPNDSDYLAAAILRLASDDDLCRKLGQAGRRMVADKFTWDESLDMMSDLYERLISDGGKKDNQNPVV
ncbi:MAG TPA: glycosyltransferase [candidate division Zixibacteria bacterium]|nr:glycosyltransferase [candidate division Zixibacteria bacterium]